MDLLSQRNIVQQLLSEAISSLAANIETKALGIQQECDHD
jgi:hypothetical protein